MNNAFIDAIRKRRSQYALGSDLPITAEMTTQLIKEAVRQAPSSFNSQSSRVVILYGAHHQRFWSFVMEALRQKVAPDAFAPTEAKINSFAAGAGTVLFYEDQHTIAALQEQFPSYAENFPVWSEQGSGIAQFAVWTALANVGIGASLQHYNPLPDAAAANEWQLPSHWTLRAQMPFGSHQGAFKEKEYMDDSERFRVFGI